MRRIKFQYQYVAVFLIFLLCFSSPYLIHAAPGDVLFTDSFDTRDYVDVTQTMAVVDIVNGEVVLPRVSSAGGMAAKDNVMIIQNGNDIEVYQDGGSTYQYQSSYYSQNTMALAMRQQSVDHFRLEEDGTGYYMSYTGSGYVENPTLQLAGLDSVVSITWLEDRMIGLDILKRQLRQFAIAETGWVELPAIQTNIENPMQVISVGQNIAVLDEQGSVNIYGFTDQLHASPIMALSGADLVAVASDADNRIIALGTTEMEEHDLSNMSQSVILNHSESDFQDIVSIAPGRILVRDGTRVEEYALTGEGDWINTGRSISASGKSNRYLSPREYVSKGITLPYPVRGVQLVSTHTKPPSTDIKYLLSIDGGEWEETAVSGGIIRKSEEFQSVRIKAILSTEIDQSPRIQEVQLVDRSMSIDDFIVTEMIRNPGNVLPTSNPVTVMGGYRFDFEVIAPGADEVYVQFSDGSAEMKLVKEDQDGEESGNVFVGNYYFAYDALVGSMFDVHIRAIELVNMTEETKLLEKHFTIIDNIFDSAQIFTIK